MNFRLLTTILVCLAAQLRGATTAITAGGNLLSGYDRAGVSYPTTIWGLNLIVEVVNPPTTFVTPNVTSYQWPPLAASGQLMFGSDTWLFDNVQLTANDYVAPNDLNGYLLRAYGQNHANGEPVMIGIFLRQSMDADLAQFPVTDQDWTYQPGLSGADLNIGIDENGAVPAVDFFYLRGSLTRFTSVPIPEPKSALSIFPLFWLINWRRRN